MSHYEVINSQSSHHFGRFQADSAEDAIEACCRDAGYASKAEAEYAMGRGSELVAFDVTKNAAAAA